MLDLETKQLCLSIRENFGLAHERQILEIASPDAEFSSLRDTQTGELFPLQRSESDPSRSFVLLELRPFQSLDLEACDEIIHTRNPVNVNVWDGIATIQNNLVALRVPVGEWQAGGGNQVVPGPIDGFRIEGDYWRGSTFLDVRAKVVARRGWLEENGPLRVVACYRVELEDEGFYESRITLNADQILATVTEHWSAGAGDQVVWDFAGVDFPQELLLLDSSAGYTARKIHPHFDQRHARLWCWTQQSQLHDLRDGFALKFEGEENAPVAGFITLDGGQWQGNRLNHLEAWTRRWWRNDPFSRRGQGWDSKADSLPSSDAIAFRGQSVSQAHFNLEGWLAESGQRSFALVLTRENEICPPGLLALGDEKGCLVALNHFENKPQREQYALEQSALRRIHIQRGIFSLRDVIAIDTSIEAGRVEYSVERVGYLSSIVEEHLRHTGAFTLEERKHWLFDYLSARVYGFWEAGGLAYTNPVSSRSIAPAMLLFEYLAATGHLTFEEQATIRAQLLFLATLFFSDNCYPGDATMQPLGSHDSVEPTLAGMANQNFFTDIFNTYGLAAQVFPHHPDAPKWRAAFDKNWCRQLEYHVYPQSGVWEESHTYYQHVLHTVLLTCVRRRDDGVADDFANSRFQNMVRGALLQITPRDAYLDGARHLVAFGDHNADVTTYGYLYRALAHAFASNNEELAAHLAWLYREMNGREPLQIEPKPIEWESGPVQGLGYFFRTTNDDGTQNLLALRSGGAWAHHHHDDGSLQFFAGGRALIIDAAFGYGPKNPKRKFLASGHSRWSLAAQEPFNFFWRFNRGQVESSDENGRFPYAAAHCPLVMVARDVAEPYALKEPITHWRRIVQLAPAAFLVIDESDAREQQIVRFHLSLTDFQIEGSVLCADYPRMQNADAICLRIASLTGAVPMFGPQDVPDQPHVQHLTTQEVHFPVGQRSVTLICAQSPEQPFEIEGDTITGENWKVRLTMPETSPKGTWQLQDEQTNETIEWVSL